MGTEMRSICGWHNAGEPENIDFKLDCLRNAIKSCAREAGINTYSAKNSTFAIAEDKNVYEFSGENHQIILYGREGKNNNKSSKLEVINLLRNILNKYLAEGIVALKELQDAFTVVVIDNLSGDVLIAVDRMGVHSISYVVTEDGILYASSQSMYRYFPNCRLEINNQSIYNYLYFHVIPGPETIFTNVNKIEPGGYLILRKNNIETGLYWEIEYKVNKEKSVNECKEELFYLFENCLKSYAEGDRLGAFLSGGIDSSTVVGFLSRVTNEPVKTFTIGFQEEGYDESYYADIAVKRYKTKHHTYYVTPDDVLNAIPKIADAYDQPFGNSSAVPAYYCARMAKENGVETLLAGDGGDELFGGNERYAKQYIFSLYDNIPEVIKNILIDPLLKPVSANSKIFPLRKAKRYVEQANIPMPRRLESYNLLESFGVKNVFEDEFLSCIDIDQPQKMQNNYYDNAIADGLLNKMLALDLKYAIADNDLPKVTQMCATAGVHVVFPFLNYNIIDFSTRLPAAYKVKRTKLRYFFKEALKGFLPDEIITKPKHGFGQPFGVWINQHPNLKELVYDSLNNLKKRNIVRSDFIDRLLNEYLALHPHYYGNMVWVTLMLEQWYQKHVE